MLAVDPTAVDVPAALRQLQDTGYARLGVCASTDVLGALRQRLDDIMLGRLPHEPFFFQHDSPTGAYEDLHFGKGWVGPSLSYRKVERLERDPIFLQWATNLLFERIARTAIAGPVTLYRALVFGKSAAGGTELPWHQDGGAFWGIDREPFLQIWTALDDAGQDAGCLQVLPRSHLGGLTTPEGGVVPTRFLEREDAERNAVSLPARAGEVILLHNHVWHRSRRNYSGNPRRGFTLCLMDARTRCRRKKNPRQFVTLFSD